jgi:hypothetical protein
MPTIRRQLLRSLRSDERGFAVPTALLATMAAFGLASATIVASVGTQSGSSRDQNTKAAVAAADAGLANAMLRFNRVAPAIEANLCQPIGGTVPAAADAAGWRWCPQQVGPVTFDRGTYTYRAALKAASGATPAQLKVVSQGTVDGVSRRVTSVADTVAEGYRPFGGLASVIGLDSIYLNANAEIHADIATNGNLGLNTGSLIDCGYAQVGVGKGLSPNNGTIGCTPVQGTVSLPPVNPGDVATNNQNSRICSLDPCVKANWSAATKRLSFNSGGSIVLGAAGGTFNYALCKLTLNANSYLHVAAGAIVNVYFLGPEQCAGETQPLVLHSGSKIQPTGSAAASLALLVVGSDTISTSAIFNADSSLFDCNQTFVLYAPRTGLTLNSDTEICGGVAAKSITLSADTVVRASNSAGDFELPNQQVTAHYSKPHDYLECTPSMPSSGSPDGGC